MYPHPEAVSNLPGNTIAPEFINRAARIDPPFNGKGESKFIKAASLSKFLLLYWGWIMILFAFTNIPPVCTVLVPALTETLSAVAPLKTDKMS